MRQLQPPTLSARLAAFAQSLGIGKRARRVLEQASQLRLPFKALPPHPVSIWWQAGPPLHQLVTLSRSALSGPVQEDKAEAHAVLVGVVKRSEEEFPSFDLRRIDGLCGKGGQSSASCFEDYLADLHARQVRIISYKDFVKAISLPLPRFLAGEPISLCRADWNGERVFWCGDQHLEAFAAAVAYARRRELEATLPAQLTHYQLSPEGLNLLDNHYYMLAIPAQAWNDPAFMSLLLMDGGIPYSRLTFLRKRDTPEFILLPKKHAEATALGEGLRLAGAADAVRYMRELQG